MILQCSPCCTEDREKQKKGDSHDGTESRCNTGKSGQVLDFVEEKLEMCNCSMKTIMQIQIAVEEIYVNIASYAYKEKKVKQS